MTRNRGDGLRLTLPLRASGSGATLPRTRWRIEPTRRNIFGGERTTTASPRNQRAALFFR